jgi:hypothetical protein
MPKTRWTKIEETDDYVKYHVQGWMGKRGWARKYASKKYSKPIEFDRTIEKGKCFEIPFDMRDEYES